MNVTLAIYDVEGRLVRTLVDGVMPAGANAVTWRGTDEQGGLVSSGVYLYRLEARGRTVTRKLVLLK